MYDILISFFASVGFFVCVFGFLFWILGMIAATLDARDMIIKKKKEKL